MIGTSRIEYYFIRFCILGLHYIAPICILYCGLLVSVYGFKATTYRFPLLVEAGAVAETLFYLLIYVPYSRYLQREAIHPPAPSREERRELFQLCNDNITDPEAYLRKWFLGAELREIKRENLKGFFLWAFFNRGGPPGDDDEELEGYCDATEKLLGRPIPEGRGTAQPLRLTIDKIDMLHRSIIWYWVCTLSPFKSTANRTRPSASSIFSPMSKCFCMVLASIALPSHDSSHSSPYDHTPSSPAIARLPNTQPTGTDRIPPKRNFR
jgi:hypothetical protein